MTHGQRLGGRSLKETKNNTQKLGQNHSECFSFSTLALKYSLLLPFNIISVLNAADEPFQFRGGSAEQNVWEYRISPLTLFEMELLLSHILSRGALADEHKGTR